MTRLTVAEARAALAAEGGRAWAMSPDRFEAVAASIAAGARSAAIRPAPTGNATALVVIAGPLTHRPGFVSSLLGSSTYTTIRQQVAAAAADPAVARIMLLIDSPGGTVSGLPETADVIAAAAKVKPVIAIADALAASAAYWIGSQATRLIAAPSASVGSIGVFALHLDASRALDQMGMTPTFVVSRASPRKVDGNSLQPLSDPARAHFQSEVDAVADKFIAAVARGRRVSAAAVAARFGRGQLLMAEPALAAGMIDQVATFESLVAETAIHARPVRAGTAETRARRLRLAGLAGPVIDARRADADTRRRKLRALAVHAAAVARRRKLRLALAR